MVNYYIKYQDGSTEQKSFNSHDEFYAWYTHEAEPIADFDCEEED